MNLRTLLFLLSGVVVFFGCDFLGIGGSDKQEVDFENPVYANVFFERTQTPGAPIQGIIAINYDNPKEFKLLASDSSTYRNLSLSPDGEKLVYSDRNEVYGIYNIITKEKTRLNDGGWPVFGHVSFAPVWDINSNGFYFTNNVQAFSIDQSVLYFNLETKRGELIKEAYPYSIIPIGLFSSDSLLVYSTEFDTLAYYRMKKNGDYIGLVENPNLTTVIEDGLDKRGFLDVNYNDSLGLIIASFECRRF